MIHIKTIKQMREKSKELNQNGHSIGFVATMGYLHEGHLQLVKNARKENDFVVVSIFVNPLQFNQTSDLTSYPRDLERDAKLLEAAGVDIVFHPDVEEMYPSQSIIQMSLLTRQNVLCGASRPGHFEGVLKVLSKLFLIIQPTKTYFGLKDAQQVAVVDALIKDLNFNITLVPVPTEREPDGLAMSSRNVRLSPAEREEAPNIYRALKAGQQYIQSNENWSRDQVIDHVKYALQKRISGEIDYVNCLTYPDLRPLIKESDSIIIAIAVHYKEARLIDNLILNQSGEEIYRGDE
ncbi:pantoate--beta-alanine ligase [Allobacillus sp. GCM10007491]|uniref:Pantothenate synthetase n=1 Tax=Allobacillus saliphilus TaxID=2912308 RepID=A0A941CVD2_9BACI|nr:pantoate--beta-alanine ligase [Allobacillus saliphilus]MBR7553231.1 pantoate--beta-alanine ligase [Allobacillus saliphilus]